MKREFLSGRPKHISRFPAVMLFLVLLIVLLFWAELSFVRRYTPVRVDGDSMLKTLEDGDWLYADGQRTPRRGDIVIVDVSDSKDDWGHPLFSDGTGTIDFIVKRLIAMEGDSVRYENGEVCVRYAGTDVFVPLTDPHASGDCGFFPETTLQKGEIFVLGDNRAISKDSTEVGVLKEEDIMGVIPEWAVTHKGAITRWESLRESIRLKLR